MDEWALLGRFMPPVAETDTHVDWAVLGESWGSPFPADYQRFIATYGAGSADNYLAVFKPECKGGQTGSGYGGMLLSTADAEFSWRGTARSPELQEASPELISWGCDASADILCWDASNDDPDTWPVLVMNRDDSLWRRYECGMVEFLARILRRDFAECPLGALSLWGKQSVLFLNQREEERLLEQGLDPWTGEPDPFAGMSWD